MKRPLCVIMLFYIAGMLFGRYCSESVNITLFIIPAVCVAAVLYFRYSKYIILFFPIAAVLGCVLFTNQHDQDLKPPIQGEVTISGYVAETSISSSGRQKVIINSTDSLKIYAVLDEGETVVPGQFLTVHGEMLPLDTARNPGAFDEFQYFRSKWVHYKMFPELIEKGGVRHSLNSVLASVSLRCAQIFDSILPENEAGIMKAMVLGDTSGLSSEISHLYSDSGIYHILSVSGLHVAILAQILNAILKKFKLRKNKASIITLMFLVAYCLLTGAGSATVRATIMCCALIIGEMIGRDSDSLTSVSFAALCLLVFSPMKLFDFGFLYSFTAVYGFIFGGKVYNSLIFYLKRKAKCATIRKILNSKFVGKMLASSVIATVAVSPLSAFAQYKIPLSGVLLNVIIAPTAVFILAFGFVAVIIGLINIGFASFVIAPVYYLLKIYEQLCRIGLSLPFSVINTGRPSMFLIIGAYLLISIAIWRRKFLKFAAPIFALALIVCALIPRPMNIAFLDVGQGDCVVASGGNEIFLIDGGGSMLKAEGENTGATVVIPYLNYLGANTVSAAFMTHEHEDHAFGILEMLKAKKTEKLYLPTLLQGKEDEIELLERILNAAKEHGTEVNYIKDGDVVNFQNGISVECLFPYDDTTHNDGNEICLVLKVIYGETEMLVTGDIGVNEEAKILQGLEDERVLSSDILKVAHHGSKNSTTDEFLECVNPKVSVIGVSKTNPHGHPAPQTMEKLKAQGCAIYTTAENGAILIGLKKNGFTVDSMLKSD